MAKQTCSYDNFRDWDNIDNVVGLSSKIIFSEICYRKFINLIEQSNLSGNETGCFFLGNEVNGVNSNQIFITDFTSDLITSDGTYKGGAVEFDRKHYMELKSKVSNGKRIIFHFHTHPRKGNYYQTFSDGDYEAFKQIATFPNYQFYTDDEIRRICQNPNLASSQIPVILNSLNENVTLYNKKVDHFSILASPVKNKKAYQFSTLYSYPYLKNGKLEIKFYKFPTICYILGDKVVEIGSYSNIDIPNLTLNKPRRTGAVQTQGLGEGIGKDIIVGNYIDGKISFTKEHRIRK